MVGQMADAEKASHTWFAQAGPVRPSLSMVLHIMNIIAIIGLCRLKKFVKGSQRTS